MQSHLLLKTTARFSLGLIMGCLLLISCREQNKEVVSPETDKDEIIGEQREKSLEEAREKAGRDSSHPMQQDPDRPNAVEQADSINRYSPEH